MKKIFILNLLIIIFFNTFVYSKIVKPNIKIRPLEVVKIQLDGLKKNDFPYIDIGIEQTWEFAHPNNKGQSYNMLLNHRKHKIKKLFSDKNIAVFDVTVLDNSKRYYKFTWHVEKYLGEGPLKNCWLTTIVSEPVPLGSSI